MTAVLDRPSSVFALAKEATPENAAAMSAVLELAGEWNLGALPLHQVRHLCTGYDRVVAVNHATGPDKELLMTLLDALVAEQDERDRSVQTTHGRFTQADIHEYGGLLVNRNGSTVLVWPSFSNDGRWVYSAERVRQ